MGNNPPIQLGFFCLLPTASLDLKVVVLVVIYPNRSSSPALAAKYSQKKKEISCAVLRLVAAMFCLCCGKETQIPDLAHVMEHISFEEINTRTIPRRPHTPPPSCAPVDSLGDPPSLDGPLPVLRQGSLWHFGTWPNWFGIANECFCFFSFFLYMVIHAKEGETKLSSISHPLALPFIPCLYP